MNYSQILAKPLRSSLLSHISWYFAFMLNLLEELGKYPFIYNIDLYKIIKKSSKYMRKVKNCTK